MRAQTRYTLWRTRRLWAATTGIAILGVIPGVVAGTFSSPLLVLGLIMFSGAIMLGFLRLYPTAIIDALAWSVGLAVVYSCLPVAAEFVARTSSDKAQLAWMVCAGVLFLVWAFTVLGATLAIASLDTLPAGQHRHGGLARLDLKPSEALSALALQPDTRLPHRTTGPADAEGWFEVCTKYQMPSPDTFEMEPFAAEYRAKILPLPADLEVSDGGFAQVTQVALVIDDRATSSVHQQVFLPDGPDGKCTLYRSAGISDHLTWLSYPGFWLQDFAADHMQAEVDLALGRPTLALCRKPQRSFLTDLARWMQRLEGHPGPG